MNAVFVWIALAVVIVAAIYIVFNLAHQARLARERKALRTVETDDSKNRWRAVKVVPGLICCRSAEIMAERVFLAKESPSLPLHGCSERQCTCRYNHLAVRRSGGDRRAGFDELTDFLPFNQVERRIVSRRSADAAA